MPLRGLSALLLLGGIVFALLSGNWGIGAIAFGLGAVVLVLDRLRGTRGDGTSLLLYPPYLLLERLTPDVFEPAP
jgi:hypothetical protein